MAETRAKLDVYLGRKELQQHVVVFLIWLIFLISTAWSYFSPSTRNSFSPWKLCRIRIFRQLKLHIKITHFVVEIMVKVFSSSLI